MRPTERTARTRTTPSPWIALLCILFGCGGAGQYGFDREYVALSDEDPFLEQVSTATYEDVRRDPADFRAAQLAWFGVVAELSNEDDNSTTVRLTHRTHQQRHLCSDAESSSCRVTVSDRTGGPFSVRVQLRPEDQAGEERMWVGSLVKVYGNPTGDFDADGGPVLQANYYRHWPRGTYVTTAAAASMRRK